MFNYLQFHKLPFLIPLLPKLYLIISPQRGRLQGTGSANEVISEKMSAAEREFIFDAVVGFLTSPIWNSPVRTFIEENSLGLNYISYIFRIFAQSRQRVQ